MCHDVVEGQCWAGETRHGREGDFEYGRGVFFFLLMNARQLCSTRLLAWWQGPRVKKSARRTKPSVAALGVRRPRGWGFPLVIKWGKGRPRCSGLDKPSPDARWPALLQVRCANPIRVERVPGLPWLRLGANKMKVRVTMKKKGKRRGAREHPP